jgi:cation diffusion facilitator family transporter
VTLAFILAEVVGGYLAHSLAIMTDAFHMISDLASFLISILAIHLARRSPTARYPFGYQRAEVLGALCSIAIIWVLTAFLVSLKLLSFEPFLYIPARTKMKLLDSTQVYLAAIRIVERKYEVEVDLMMVRFV